MKAEPATAVSVLALAFKGRFWEVALGISLLVLGKAAALAVPLSARDLMNRLWVEPELLLGWLTAVVLIATSIQAVAVFTSTRLVAVGAQRAMTDLRLRLHRHALALPVRAFNASAVGSMVTPITSDVDSLRVFAGSGMLQIVGALFSGVLALIALFWINVWLTFAIMAVLAVSGVTIALLFFRARPIANARGRQFADLNASVTETVSAIRLVKAYAAEDAQQRAFSVAAHRLLSETRAGLRIDSLQSVTTLVAIGLLTVVTIQIGGRSLLAGEMASGDFVAYFILMGFLAGSVSTLASHAPQVTSARAGLDRIVDFLAQSVEEQPSASTDLPRLKGDVEFRDVSFGYPDGPAVLRNVSCVVPAGAKIILTGQSGAGKSTLFSLLMGFEKPQAGQVLVDGREVVSLPLSAYRKQIGVVMQDDALLDGTIRENILFGRPDATEDQLRAVCESAHVLEFADRLPQGLETRVGERGVFLSGGQRQRVSIARAMLRDPVILLLDEATAHLDPASEALVCAGLDSLMSGRTTFIIAHRPETISGADQRLHIESG